MKTIYFVRHGETAGNVGGFWQTGEEPLNPRGLEQADRVAERAKNITIDRLLASTMVRAQQTAGAVSREINLPVESSDLFREIKDPSSVMSSGPDPEKDAIIEIYRSARIEHENDPLWRFEDEETKVEFFERIKTALVYLADLPEENIMVVSHGNFIRSMIGLLVQDLQYVPGDYFKFNRQITTTNTGITILRYENDRFRLLSYNDHAHFAE
jgi:broad specificity phosphatase PhoE